MRLTLNIDPNDIAVCAEWLEAKQKNECTSAQHEAIAQQTMARLVVCGAMDATEIQSHPAVRRVFKHEYDEFNRSQRRAGHLPRSRRTVI